MPPDKMVGNTAKVACPHAFDQTTNNRNTDLMTNTKSTESSLSIEPARRLGFWTTAAIVVGCMIGSGIFKKPAVMAAQLGSPWTLLAVWMVAGFVTLAGALATAELAALFPQSGGPYNYFKKVYGPFFAFLYGWSCFLVIQSGSIASIAYVCAEYFDRLVILPRFAPEIEAQGIFTVPWLGTINTLGNAGVKILTLGIIGFLTVMNIRGVRIGGRIQVLFTSLKLLAIFALIVVGLALGSDLFSNLTFSEPAPGPKGTTLVTSFWQSVAVIGAAMAGAFWAYDGWLNATFIAGEVKDPERVIPRALTAGIGTVILVYILTNLSYLAALPFGEMSQTKLVAATSMEKLVGPVGVLGIAIAIMISTFGATNGSIMGSARLYFAMAKDRLFLKRASELHTKNGTPHMSLAYQCFWSCVMVITGTFDQLTDMLIFVLWFFFAAAVLAVIVARKKFPALPRPYKTKGYPLIPLLFVAFAVFFWVSTLWRDITDYQEGRSTLIPSLFGVALIAVTSPLYWWFKRDQEPVKKS